ncbi:MAG: hypothetical protein ACM3ML_08265 [Micromonosporaceae bacterium]
MGRSRAEAKAPTARAQVPGEHADAASDAPGWPSGLPSPLAGRTPPM